MTAEDLPRSREEKVARLAQIKAEQDRLKTEYEALRDEVVVELDGEHQFFIDPTTGLKRLAYRVAPEMTKVDVEALASYVDEDVLEEVTERKVRTDAFWQAVKAGRIPDKVAVKVTTLVPQTPHVRFGDPNDLAKHAP